MTLGLLRGNSVTDAPTPIIDMSFMGNKLYGKWDFDEWQNFTGVIGTEKAFHIYRDNMIIGSIHHEEDDTLCIRTEAGPGMILKDKNNNVFLSHEYNKLLHSLQFGT